MVLVRGRSAFDLKEMRDMRTRICRILLTLGLLLAPSAAYAQIEVPPVIFTGPLSHPRYADGGFYTGFQFLSMKTNRPLKDQNLAIRGIRDFDGTASGTGIPNTFIGSGEPALNMNDVRGPGIWQPGWDIFFGWRFENGIAVEFNWRHLVQASYNAQVGLIPWNFNVGSTFENTFLFSPVTNFTNDWAGNPNNIPIGSSAATFGIWNAASTMQLEYVQRYDTYSINARLPIWDGSEFRTYGLFGPRIVWIYDRTTWRTVDQDEDGNADGSTVGVYSNTISNRMYGVHGGFGNDWFLGSTPIGGFACSWEVEGGLYFNPVKTRAAWERGDRAIGLTRSRRFNNLVPSAEAKVGLWWYPWEAISVQIGYDIQTYFNTITSYRPVDFNMGTIDPQYDSHFFRWFHGFRVGIGFVF
jgi:hypothetical protein